MGIRCGRQRVAEHVVVEGRLEDGHGQEGHSLGQTRGLDAQIQMLGVPSVIMVGFSPIGFVRCGRSACRISALQRWVKRCTFYFGGPALPVAPKLGCHGMRLCR